MKKPAQKASGRVGRKTLDPSGEVMKCRQFKATDAQWEKCKALGGGNRGSYLRAKIDEAPCVAVGKKRASA